MDDEEEEEGNMGNMPEGNKRIRDRERERERVGLLGGRR